MKPAATTKKPKAEKLPPMPREPPGWETTEEGKLVGIFGATAETLEKAQDRYETDRKDLVGRRVIATDEDGDWTAVLVQFMPQETKDSRRDRDPEFYNKAWYKLHYYESCSAAVTGAGVGVRAVRGCARTCEWDVCNYDMCVSSPGCWSPCVFAFSLLREDSE